MAAVLVTATERTSIEGNAPRRAAIDEALAASRLLGGEEFRGRWLGEARVTRRAVVPVFETTFAAVYVWPTRGPWTAGAPLRQLSIDLRNNVARQLSQISSDWSPVRIVPWSESEHGALAAWESGAMARTRTRDEFPTGAGRLDAPENPVGPSARDVRPSGLRDVPEDVLRTLAPWALGGFCLYLLATRSSRR